MLKKSKSIRFICFYCLIFDGIFIRQIHGFNCHLPEKCRSENAFATMFSSSDFVIFCHITKDGFEFAFKEPTPLINGDICDNDDYSYNIIFKWTSNKELSILDKRFNFTNAFRYLGYFKTPISVYIWELNGFDVNLFEDDYSFENKSAISIEFRNCPLVFYDNKRKLQSCQDFIDLNITKLESIFQLNKLESTIDITLKSVEYKQKTCPFVFTNARLEQLFFDGLVDTFYKRSVLSFSSEIFTELNSTIKTMMLKNVQAINFDVDLFHPSIFNNTEEIIIYSGSLNSINGGIFKNLKCLISVKIDQMIFKKIIHKQGITWIRQINHDVNLNSSNIPEDFRSHKEIGINELLTDRKLIAKIFPEEDFCIYVDFPFNQMVIVYKIMVYEVFFNRDFNDDLTCTYLWLARYYPFYYKYYMSFITDKTLLNLNSLMVIMNSTSFKSISKCNFEQKRNSCNKSNYQIEDIWDRSDFLILSKKLQTAFKILLYPTASLGLITNIIVFVVIQLKENSDLFNELKHFSYLCLNSVFCILVLIIEILSWMTECFYPYEVFCPEIRKLVAIQLFKIIVKECLVTMFRFMCNFTYVAFALNRISLIGNEHGRVVTFFSELAIKKYIGIALLISVSLSWIKYFKYNVNFYDSDSSFPILNEVKILYSTANPPSHLYFIFNSISELINYVVFVVVCVIIDICMVVQLRQVLEEKTKKSESMMDQKQSETKKAENEEAVNKAIKMVVLNTAIGILFKLPVSLIPLLNVIADFCRQKINDYKFTYFFNIYIFLIDSEFYNFIEDMSNFLFTLSMSIQLFIYHRFDKKFRTGYERLMDKILTRKKTT